jgi:hypothetical protein
LPILIDISVSFAFGIGLWVSEMSFFGLYGFVVWGEYNLISFEERRTKHFGQRKIFKKAPNNIN